MGKRYRGENGQVIRSVLDRCCTSAPARSSRRRRGPGSTTAICVETDDGERLHGWRIGARTDLLGHLLLCHGNAATSATCPSRRLLRRRDSTCCYSTIGAMAQQRPAQRGGHLPRRPRGPRLPARAARGGTRARSISGESFGGAVALDLALERPPTGPVLLSAFTGFRELGRRHYPFVPAGLDPRRLSGPASHSGAARCAPGPPRGRDDIVPLAQGRALSRPPRGRSACMCSPASATTISSRGRGGVRQVIASWARRLRRRQRAADCGRRSWPTVRRSMCGVRVVTPWTGVGNPVVCGLQRR